MSTPDPTDDWLDRAWRYVAPVLFGGSIAALWFLVPLGLLALAAFGYLRSGEWEFLTLGDLTGWQTPQTEWIGFNEIIKWVLGLWAGFHSLILGGLILWIVVHSDK